METDERVIKLENKLKIIELQQKQLIKIVLHQTPEWAKDSLEAAESAGLVDLPYMGVSSDGSYDFYRIINLLDKLGLLQQ